MGVGDEGLREGGLWGGGEGGSRVMFVEWDVWYVESSHDLWWRVVGQDGLKWWWWLKPREDVGW